MISPFGVDHGYIEKSFTGTAMKGLKRALVPEGPAEAVRTTRPHKKLPTHKSVPDGKGGYKTMQVRGFKKESA